MSPKRPWATKSAAHRIGLVPCSACNPEGRKAEEIAVACAWCWRGDIGEHTRFVPVDKAIEWATAHGLDVSDVATPAQHRGALADTDPAGLKLDEDPDSDPIPPTDKNC